MSLRSSKKQSPTVHGLLNSKSLFGPYSDTSSNILTWYDFLSNIPLGTPLRLTRLAFHRVYIHVDDRTLTHLLSLTAFDFHSPPPYQYGANYNVPGIEQIGDRHWSDSEIFRTLAIYPRIIVTVSERFQWWGVRISKIQQNGCLSPVIDLVIGTVSCPDSYRCSRPWDTSIRIHFGSQTSSRRCTNLPFVINRRLLSCY